MTVRDLFSCACTDTEFKVTVHDTHYRYLENLDGDSVLYVDFSEQHVYDADCTILEKVAECHVREWWINLASSIVHIVIEEDLPVDYQAE